MVELPSHERQQQQQLTCLTWNLHGKGTQHVSTLLHGLETPPDIFFFQELGDVRALGEGSSRVGTEFVAGREYQVFLANPLLSHRCCAVLIALDLEFTHMHVHVHEFGVIVQGSMHEAPWFVASLHFPHQQRRDAVDTWERGVSHLLGKLSGLPWETNVVLGHDLNQDAHSLCDDFAGMLHYREMVFQAALQLSPPLGDTWIARGSSSPIDFFLYQIRGAELSFHKREDLRIALPSDHNAIGMDITFRCRALQGQRRRPARTLCGKWQVDGRLLLDALQDQLHWDDARLAAAFRSEGVSHRPKSLRYVDPPEIRGLISTRRRSSDPWLKTALMQEIHQARIEARARHKEFLLTQARAGNCRAIAHMRASASGGQTEGSYVKRAGGAAKATQDLFAFYEAKYSCAGPRLTEDHFRHVRSVHQVEVAPEVTKAEILRAMRGTKSGVSDHI